MKKIALVLAATVILSVIGSGSFFSYKLLRESGKKYHTVRLAESRPEIRKLPHYLAVNQSFYGEQKVRLKPVACADDREALAALEKGKADVALVNSSSLVIRRAASLKEGAGPVAFASLDRGTSYHLVAREDKPVADIQTLKGRTVISGPQDSLETVFFENLLRDAGIGPYESVTIITNIPEELRMGALKAGTGHYLLVEEKELPAALARGFFRVKSFKTEFPSLVCITTRDFARGNQEALQGFTNALYMAQTWLKHHTPAETAAELGSIPGAGKDIFPGLAAKYYESGSLNDTPVLQGKSMDAVVKMLDRAREIPMPVSGSEMVTAEFADVSVKTVNYFPRDKQERKGLQRLKFWD